MKVFAHLVIIGLDMAKNKSYIISTDSEQVTYPVLEITNENKDQVESAILDKLIQTVYIDDHLISCPVQVITLNFLTDKEEMKDDLNVAFGFIVSYDESASKDPGVHWISFDYLDPRTYDSVIFQTIQRLK